MSGKGFFQKIELSAALTIVGIFLLFSTAILATLIAPSYVDDSWISPTSPYQVQMYEVEDPNIYISSASSDGLSLQYVHHIKEGFTLLAFKEARTLRIVAPEDLQPYITKIDASKLTLTFRIFLIRELEEDMVEKARQVQEEDKFLKITVLELYDPEKSEAFSYNPSEGFLQNWVDENYRVVDPNLKVSYHSDPGVVFVQNPREYRIKLVRFGAKEHFVYDAAGEPVKEVAQLTDAPLKFRSRRELIAYGEHLYAIEGCWYCHTDQTRTLIQDVVLNGADSYPAPPSSPNEYIYQKITFPGTRRIGPDLSRTGIKRASRDWNMAHFWDPKTASAGSIMPAFRHFFDFDPSGSGSVRMGIPNHRFEAIYQYLMTKGTRITPPTEAWWIGKDPVNTIGIIEGPWR